MMNGWEGVAGVDPDRMYKTSEAAALLGLTHGTLRTWRMRNVAEARESAKNPAHAWEFRGPRYRTYEPGLHRYRGQDLIDYMQGANQPLPVAATTDDTNL